MDVKKLSTYFRHLLMSVIISTFLYKVFTNRYINSYAYGKLKYSLREILQINDAADIEFCFLKNPFYRKPAGDYSINCFNCESLKIVRKIYDITYEDLDLFYIRQNIPVIVTDAMYDWPLVNKDLHFGNITEVYLQDSLKDNIPCYALTNINLQTKYISDFLGIILNPLLKHWFINWKNCDIVAVKALRNFYQQPYFTKYFLPAANINWVLLSSNYKTGNFEQFPTDGKKLLSLMQLKGSFDFQLIPRTECSVCSIINGTLNEEEILVISSELWEMQCSPRSDEESIAILTENEL